MPRCARLSVRRQLSAERGSVGDHGLCFGAQLRPGGNTDLRMVCDSSSERPSSGSNDAISAASPFLAVGSVGPAGWANRGQTGQTPLICRVPRVPPIIFRSSTPPELAATETASWLSTVPLATRSARARSRRLAPP